MAARDCWTAFDATWGDGGFWREGLPPGLRLATNNLKSDAPTDHHRDFTATGFPHGAFDVVFFDPPHVADGGENGIMAAKYGTVKTTSALYALIVDGARECSRIARRVLVVKVTNHSHGGEWLDQAGWVVDGLMEGVARPMVLYCTLHTIKEAPLIDRKWVVQRAPKVNGAQYLVFRHESDRDKQDGHKHRDFARLYARQQERGA